MKVSLLALAAISSATAYTTSNNKVTWTDLLKLKSSVNNDVQELVTAEIASEDVEYKPILRDPLGLYPVDAAERQQNRIVPLEPTVNEDRPVTDPLNLYNGQSSTQVTSNADMSMSLPFLKRPVALDGSLPGDRGFDPFNFSSDEKALMWYRKAEIKHARLAMLAAAGWPMAELFDKKIAAALDMKPLLVWQDRVPSILNGGLSRIPLTYWVFVLSFATIVEGIGYVKEFENSDDNNYIPGDLGFDPLGLYGKTEDERKFKLEAELFNGRLGMLAITGFAIQEWWTQNSVINETPIFFKPINVALEQLADAAGNSL